MKNHENRDRIDAFISRCSEHNLKVTPQRVSIYKIIFQSTSHPTADEIFQAIKKDFQNITFDTVNRTLLTFSGMGIIDVIVSYQGARRFDPNLENHHHFHCIQCGKIFDFSC